MVQRKREREKAKRIFERGLFFLARLMLLNPYTSIGEIAKKSRAREEEEKEKERESEREYGGNNSLCSFCWTVISFNTRTPEMGATTELAFSFEISS